MFCLLMSEEMGGLRCLLLVLLLSSLQAVGGEDSGNNCAAPPLINGYYVPEGNSISYSCENGYKPAVEGWWAVAECVNGKWSHNPECIDVNDCTVPDVPVNAIPRQPLTWIKNGKHVGFDCEGAYELEGSSTMKCENGEWTPTVSCKKREDACGEPPFVNNAVITQKYQDVFAANEEVKYECEEGFTLDEGGKCLCQSGSWIGQPTCKPSPQTTPAPSEENREEHRGDGGRPGPVNPGRQPVTTDSPPKTGGHGDRGRPGAVNPGRQPAMTDSPPKKVVECGPLPVLDNGGIASQDQWSLTYKCSPFYKLQGSAKVTCLSNGNWSPKPTCLEPCTIPVGNPRDDIIALRETKFISTEESDWFRCKNGRSVRGTCKNGEMTYEPCEQTSSTHPTTSEVNRPEPCLIPMGIQHRGDIRAPHQNTHFTNGQRDWFYCIWHYYFARGICANGQMMYGQCEQTSSLMPPTSEENRPEPCIIPKGIQPTGYLRAPLINIFFTSGHRDWFYCTRLGYHALGTCTNGQMTYGQCP